jgi:hypothetical protein
MCQSRCYAFDKSRGTVDTAVVNRACHPRVIL